MQKIAVTNHKGEVGKTTTSICVAQELLKRGKRVLFIDTDTQSNSTKFYEAATENASTILDILCGDMPAAECVQHTSKGDINPSDKLLSDAENMVKLDERRFTHLKRSLKPIEDLYDYIIIDTPSSIGVVLKNVLATVNYVIIPVEEYGWSFDGLMDFSEALELARDNNENLKVAGIFNRKSERTNSKIETNG